MRFLLVPSLTLLTAFAALSQTTTTGWKLVWSDEFNGAAGTPPDPTKWNYDLGGGGWGNGEAETYTNSPNNVFQDGNGNLVIRAIRDASGNYTSARLQTGLPGSSQGTADLSWQYGLIEARIKLPFGHGVWPAFWMLGENIGTVGWPACGETDIMENFGTYGTVNDAAINNGTAHGPVATGSTSDYSAGGQYTLPLGELVSDDYHVYAIQWSENSVAFSVDGALYYTATPSAVPGIWEFNAPFFILLNLAIGGPNTFLGTPDPSAPFPNPDMLVDYVRVYQPTTVSSTTPVITPSAILNAASYLGEVAPGSLAAVFGYNLADNTYQGAQLLDSNGHFSSTVAGVSVSVNGVNAPLIYVSPGQIDFQVPWETAPGTAVNVQVTRASAQSNVETITIASTASPSMFLNDYTTGVAWVTGTVAEGCPVTECAVQAGSEYQLWANGLGPKNLPEQDGVGDGAKNINDLSVVGGTASCQLTVGGIAATVDYCGAAPGFIIDQLNFTYPAGTVPSALVEAVLTINGATGRFWLPGILAPPASAVSVALSTNDQSALLAAQSSVNFTNSSADADTNTIVVDPAQQYQTIEGFGAAFTDSAAYLLMNVAPSTALPETLNDLFTRDGDGIGLSFMRIPMGASDIALSVYSFDDMPVGETDPSLANFSIAHDQVYILPLIQQAKRLNPQMKLMANPWSPPGWMKDPTSMNPVSMLGGTLLMTGANETAFAKYFVKYIQAYQAAGVPIDYISLQNEPLNITTSYPSMGMSDSTQLALLQSYVLPALAANNISTKVFVYDHNWDTPSYPEYVLGGLTTQQLTQVAGTAWHGYGGAPGAQQLVQNMFPSLGAWETEHSGGTWIADQFTSDFLEITQVLRNSAKSYVKWSLALNENLGPNLTQNVPGLGGCDTCTPIVTVNSQTGAVTKDVEFYTLGQYSKYVLPGAVRVYSSNTPAISSVAFENPDGSMALIVFNNSGNSQTFKVQWGTQSFPYTLAGAAAATYTWTGTASGSTPPMAATAQIQGSSFSSESGLETEATGDATGEYDLGYISPGAYVVYKNIDFGTAVSQVNVRTASAGNGGTATFYLDSMTSSPIATVNLPVTGGWQTWTTATAAASGASGVHDLYVVFGGGGSTGSISNVNWFQFQ
jgi:glucosylceramidase